MATILSEIKENIIVFVAQLIILGFLIVLQYYLPHKLKQNNEVIPRIEKTIILNYDYINEKNNIKKTEILDKFKTMSANKFSKNDVEEFIKLL